MTRGLLGGVLGGLVWAALLIFMQLNYFGSTWGQWLFAEFLLFGLPMGVFLGGLSASMIWLIHRMTGINVGIMIRAILGMLVALVPWLIYWLITDRTGFIPTPWQEDLVDAVRFAVALGSLAAMFVGKQEYEESSINRNQLAW